MTNINIRAYRKNTIIANNFVSGRISQSQMILFDNIKDANIYAKSGDTFFGCVISDNNGRYHLSSLPTGNIKIIVDRLGYTGDSTFVNVTPISNIDSVNFSLIQTFVGVKKIDEIIPASYKLYQNYPNPFNPATNIKYQITKNGIVSLKVFDILGREVVELINEKQNPGFYEVSFNASGLPSGVYFYTLKTGEFKETKKLLLLK
jgi:hypothetical protein